MLLYDNAFSGNYEEFKTWYEVSYRDVLEMDALWQAYGTQMDQVQEGILTAIQAMFIKYADERAVALWERFLWVNYDDIRRRTLEERKKVILSYFMENGHIGEPEIRELLRLFSEAQYTVELNGGSIDLEIEDTGDLSYITDFYHALLRKIPAHLGLWITTRTTIEQELFWGSAVVLERAMECLSKSEDTTDSTSSGQLIVASGLVLELGTEWLHNDALENDDEVSGLTYMAGGLVMETGMETLEGGD